ncbi:MAG: hypothetical protein AAF830_14735 [Pseudomonadota bacterium]
MVDIVDVGSLEWKGTPGHRDGDISMKTLFKGTDGEPNNYWLVLFRVDGVYDAPLHAHNFEQVRIMLEGAFDFGPQVQDEGTVGYFCEGTRYRQTARGNSTTLLLQCEGASRSRYVGIDELRRAAPEMIEAGGRFVEGVYEGPGPDGQTIRRDGALAVYEWVVGEEPVIPNPYLTGPAIIHPDRLPWGTEPSGIRRRSLGTFGGRGLSIDVFETDGAGRIDYDSGAHGGACFYVVEGGGAVDGRSFGRGHALRIAGGEKAEIDLEKASNVIRLILPR